MNSRNVIDAICEIVNTKQYNIKAYAVANNRANAEGDALEDYIKDVFAGTVNDGDSVERDEKLSECFSYLGNTSNPPDMMIRGGDAIEVKKIKKVTSGIALNSSYPKSKLYADSRMISKACRESEKWNEKDMLYAVGVVNRGNLKSLMFIYGYDYCADKEVYERVYSAIKKGVKSIEGVEFGETKELGRVNRVDPLGITYLRMRGMWHIENPFRLFGKYCLKDDADFKLIAIINKDKYNSFDNKAQLEDLVERTPKMSILDTKIKNPNNPAQLREAKVIVYAYAETH